MKIETLTPGGQTVEGAECRLSNDKGEALGLSGQSVPVRRSGGNLSIHCTQAGQAPAVGSAVSRVNAGMVGNVLIGGAIGAAIDVGTGSGFNYPSWMQLVFGEERTFDRSTQQGDQPVAGVSVGTTTPLAAAKPPVTGTVVAKKDPGGSSAQGARPAAPEPAGAVPASAARVSMDDLNALLPAKP
ncbi:hypothetical protein [Variovorax sp. CF079]|uniref:hypothetical protein n=1 Tax=Variovorax sp. CF079 TaxID=1882774 RepID=UPI001BB0C474|nr:hypothetical protein [Variovorax sp. CF079]